jgi:phosphatidylserine/phosphatidylglycerophosphate/cardiolipin synthase-like enzyme
MASIQELIDKYFAPLVAGDTFTGNSEVIPLIDGQAYFDSLYAEISKTVSGDFIHIMGWYFDKTLNLPDSAGRNIIDILNAKVTSGVDVKIIAMGTYPFAEYYEDIMDGNCSFLIACRENGIPNSIMDDNVEFTGSHHIKAVIVKNSGGAFAFMGGIDLASNRRDVPEHPCIYINPHTGKYDGNYDDINSQGWHDAAVRLKGSAALAVWECFYLRWNNCISERIPLKAFYNGNIIDSLTKSFFSYEFVPYGIGTISNSDYLSLRACFSLTGAAADYAVMEARSFSQKLVGDFISLNCLKPAWVPSSPIAINEYKDSLLKAVSNAKKYIYIEDQSLNVITNKSTRFGGAAPKILFPLLKEAAIRGVKVILIAPYVTDPADGGGRDPSILGDIINELIFAPLGYPSNPTPITDAKGKTAYWNIAYYERLGLTVHSKLVIIDDEMYGIGSANAFDRSLNGTDTEMTTLVVSGEGYGSASSHKVKELRKRLWMEDIGMSVPENLTTMTATQSTMWDELDNPDDAFGIWSYGWRSQTKPKFSCELGSDPKTLPGPYLYKMVSYL